MVEVKADNAEVDLVALSPGRTIGRYEIVSILGQGGFGITYRARDTQLDREVAIKEYLPSAMAVRQDGSTVLPRSTKLADEFIWGRQRFVDEGRTLATLQRAPAIVRVFDFLEANGTAYIIMELVPGHTLEDRLKAGGTLSPAAVDRILWPLLDGLEQVHATGFLHRDIKPANILLNEAGDPTLIDFGASRAAMAGRTTAMTAVFTPGYAAAEQFTSAKQGPWTDIYGLSATLYHAITGGPLPSAFDRMLDDSWRPLAGLKPEGFAPSLLAGLDAGLAVRSQDRPQSVAAWRPLLKGETADPNATAIWRGPAGAAPQATRGAMSAASPSPPAPPGSRGGLWVGLGVVVAVALGGTGYYVLRDREAAQAEAAHVAAAQAARDAEARQQAEELARLKAEKEAREKAAAQAAERQRIEAETRRKIEAELAAKQQTEEQARQQAAAAEAARQQAQEQARQQAEAAETTLHLSTTDRQHVQVALTALGFATNATDGVFGSRTREMIAAWQKSRNEVPTGFVTGPENRALQRDAAPAIAKFDDEQKKAEEARKKADDDKAKAAAVAAAQNQAAASARVTAAPPPLAPGTAVRWIGQFNCPEWLNPLFVVMSVNNGQGSFRRTNGKGNITVSLTINGSQYSGALDWAHNNGRQTNTPFSGSFTGDTIQKDVVVPGIGRLASDSCKLDLRKAAN